MLGPSALLTDLNGRQDGDICAGEGDVVEAEEHGPVRRGQPLPRGRRRRVQQLLQELRLPPLLRRRLLLGDEGAQVHGGRGGLASDLVAVEGMGKRMYDVTCVSPDDLPSIIGHQRH